jgi:uncharacterized protein
MPLPPPSPEGTCLVTGASSGLGAEMARALARRGRGVTLVARREDRLLALAAELGGRVRAEVVACDLTDPAERVRLLEEVERLGLRVDVLVNNAGFAPAGPVHRRDPAEDVRAVQLLCEAIVDLTTRVTPGMVERGAGGVLNVASTAGFQPNPNQATYGAAKAFVLSYTDAIGAELAPRGVHVTALSPGPVPTEIFPDAGTHPVDRVPKLFWREAPEVGEAGVAALEAGRARAFVGAPNRVMAAVGQVMPRWRPALTLFAKGFTPPGDPNPARR